METPQLLLKRKNTKKNCNVQIQYQHHRVLAIRNFGYIIGFEPFADPASSDPTHARGTDFQCTINTEHESPKVR